jgi:peptide/nickel transport system substrate-binding protein
VTEQLYSTLTALDTDGRPYPDLAEWIEVSDDARTYTFGIRTGVQFHDGSPLTADDVAFSLNRIRDPGTRYHFEPWTVTMEGAEALDATTVHLRLNQVTGPILTWLAFCGAGIVPRAAVEAGHDLETAPIGSGPFRFVSATDDLVRLERHDGGDHGPNIDALEFLTIREDDERTAALLDGRIDLDVLMAPAGWNAVAASPGHTAIATQDGRWHWLMVNCADPLLGDVRVRRAIALAIDRRALAAPFGPHALPLTGGVVAPWSWAHEPDLAAFPPEGDADAARALLDEAGVAPATAIEIVELDTVPAIRRHASLIAAQLRDVGLAAEARDMTVADWGSHVTRGGPFQLATSYWGSPINDPDDFLYMGVRSGARYDLGTCGSPEVDGLLDAGRGSIDQAARTEAYRALQAQVVEHLPVIATIQPDVLRGMTRRLRGFAPLRNAQIRSLREAWLA